MNDDFVFKKLLCFGLFPEKLEGIFTSEKFGEWIIKNEGHLNIFPQERFSMLEYKLTRNNNAPRQLSIPHPIGYFKLCKEIKNYWGRINKNFQSKYYIEKSMVCPKTNNKNQRLVSMANYDKKPHEDQLKLDKQFGKKYLVCADISSCFSSIYTHSISWALVGKTVSKNNQFNKSAWYNFIDKTCQNLQDGETRGIPIGPDTSFVLSEIILSKIDRVLKNYNYVRYIDDYSCSCGTKEEAEKFIRDLSNNLEKYKLCLNAKKTKILEYPKAMNEDWVRKLRMAIEWQTIGEKEKDSVVGFLDLSSELFEKNPSESSIRYAAKVLNNKKFVDYSTYKLVLRYFLNLTFLFPYIVDTCDQLIFQGVNSFKSDIAEINSILEGALEIILTEHIKYRRSDAIVWSLFLAIKYRLTVPNFTKIERSILKTNDPISVLMAFLYKRVRKENTNIYKNLISEVNNDEWWLFVYEISRIENLRINNLNMEKIRNSNITFLSNELISSI